MRAQIVEVGDWLAAVSGPVADFREWVERGLPDDELAAETVAIMVSRSSGEIRRINDGDSVFSEFEDRGNYVASQSDIARRVIRMAITAAEDVGVAVTNTDASGRLLSGSQLMRERR